MNKLCYLRRASTGGNHNIVYDIGDDFIQVVNLKFPRFRVAMTFIINWLMSDGLATYVPSWVAIVYY
jgi:hypothetical protein